MRQQSTTQIAKTDNKNTKKKRDNTEKIWYYKNNKGKETDTAEERREDDLARPATEQGTETKTPHKPREVNTAARGGHQKGKAREKQQGQATEEGRTPRPNRLKPNPTNRWEGRRQRTPPPIHPTPPHLLFKSVSAAPKNKKKHSPIWH